MTSWNQFHFDERIRTILARYEQGPAGASFGRPFLTPYQIALEFAEQYGGDVQTMGLEIGGAGTGVQYSLSQYIASNLTRKIISGQINDIEGAYLSQHHVADFQFRNGSTQIASSLTGSGYNMSMFRYSG